MTTETIDAFETGATSAAANNLVLSVLNDGNVYEDREHCGFAMLQGSNHHLSFRDLANNEAAKQRHQFGSKFKAAEISEAAKLIQADTIAHCLEIIREEWNGENITCYGRHWWDRINGNTYFSARIVIPTASGHRWVAVPFQYGYGSQWEWECRHVLARMGFEGMADGFASEHPLNFEFQGLMKKSQMFTGLYI